ncbi:hypothetical protein C8J57DRAFT_1500292 [Mycena rebaudengoi]|nr:hypothetical protein C8J57DRAFT_1500292 [Mycena rebaudengoi]
MTSKLFRQPQMTMEERIAHRAANNPAIQKAIAEPPTGLFYKTIKPPTISAHNHIKAIWRRFAEKHETKILPLETVPGIAHLHQDDYYEFIQYLGFGVGAMLNEFPTKKTIKKYLLNFFHLWRRYAFNPIPIDLRTKAHAFLESQEFANIAPLSKQIRTKPIASRIDVKVIVRSAYKAIEIFRTNRMKIQFNAITLISAISSERPGAIMESDCYTHTNQALTWGDVAFMFFPNPEAPLHPLCGAMVVIQYTKGQCRDPSKIRHWFIWLEPFENRANCPLTLLISLAQEDGIFQDSARFEEFLSPKVAPTCPHKLRIREESKRQPVFCAEVLTEQGWEISEMAALAAWTHCAFLALLCFALGFTGPLALYAFRRLAGRNFKRCDGVTDDERTLQMGQRSYESTTGRHDLGAIFNGQDASTAAVEAMDRASSAGWNRDPNAPCRLTIEQRAKIRSIPEHVAFVQEREKVVVFDRLQVALYTQCYPFFQYRAEADRKTQLLHLASTPKALDAAKAVISFLRKAGTEAQRALVNSVDTT